MKKSNNLKNGIHRHRFLMDYFESSKDISVRVIKLCKIEKRGLCSKTSFLLDHDNFEQKYFHKLSF